MKSILGTPVSSGITIGPVYILHKNELTIPEYYIADVPYEIERLKNAISISKKEIKRLSAVSENKLSETSGILEAHLSIMEDPELLNLAQSFMVNENRNADYCFKKAAEHFASMIEVVDNDYMKARAKDIREVATLILANLLGVAGTALYELEKPSLIVAKNITVNEITGLNKKLVQGFITETGGVTDHAAILARAYGIPFVTGINDLLSEIDVDDELIIDGNKGKIIINPSSVQRLEYAEKRDDWMGFYSDALEKVFETATTIDGRKIKIYANISDKQFVKEALQYGAEGIGLLRTEFLFSSSEKIPDEDEQYHIYSSIADAMKGRTVVIRTLDIGSDKQHAAFNLAGEANPALGLRGVRLCFQKEDELFKPQIKAILRAAYKKNIRLMLPMITSVKEIKKFRALLEICKMELKNKYIRHESNILVGMMIEVPAAAILADAFTNEVDFFSIGTNDLIQYTLAADRTNSSVSYLTRDLHPAVLELIKHTVKAANKKNKPVAICGEMASDPRAVPILIGLGINELSITPSLIPVVKELIRNMKFVKAKILAQQALKVYNRDKIETLANKLIPEILQ